jgi:hypothetical protein
VLYPTASKQPCPLFFLGATNASPVRFARARPNSGLVSSQCCLHCSQFLGSENNTQRTDKHVGFLLFAAVVPSVVDVTVVTPYESQVTLKVCLLLPRTMSTQREREKKNTNRTRTHAPKRRRVHLWACIFGLHGTARIVETSRLKWRPMVDFAGRVHGPRAGREEAAGVERGGVSPDKLFTLPCGNVRPHFLLPLPTK